MDNISIGELPYREATFEDNIVIENLESATPTSRTTLKQVKEKFTGEITKESEGFIEGEKLYNRFSEIIEELSRKVTTEKGKGLSSNDFTDDNKNKLDNLKLSDIASLGDIPVWHRAITDLFRMDLQDFNNLQYANVVVTSDTMGFPSALLSDDKLGFVVTHRNEQNGYQLIIGAQSGQILSRCLVNGAISEWNKVAEQQLVDSYNSDRKDAAPTADALSQLFLLFSDKITELEMIVKGADISVFLNEMMFPPEGGIAVLTIKATGFWKIYIDEQTKN